MSSKPGRHLPPGKKHGIAAGSVAFAALKARPVPPCCCAASLEACRPVVWGGRRARIRAPLQARTSRVVTVQLPGLSIRVAQPWSKPRGLLLKQLSVTVTVAAGSKRRLGGKLGATLPGMPEGEDRQ